MLFAMHSDSKYSQTSFCRECVLQIRSMGKSNTDRYQEIIPLLLMAVLVNLRSDGIIRCQLRWRKLYDDVYQPESPISFPIGALYIVKLIQVSVSKPRYTIQQNNWTMVVGLFAGLGDLAADITPLVKVTSSVHYDRKYLQRNNFILPCKPQLSSFHKFFVKLDYSRQAYTTPKAYKVSTKLKQRFGKNLVRYELMHGNPPQCEDKISEVSDFQEIDMEATSCSMVIRFINSYTGALMRSNETSWNSMENIWQYSRFDRHRATTRDDGSCLELENDNGAFDTIVIAYYLCKH
ncbi:hypothetical protein CLF_102579 [Clonorchis sinensis]|uniref:Uncharacterized protein n=1 Tax=Clonorchis sinensis TaxID=79923 RepID=G7Y859_CLOSI|nr:hypothetical protein CLF_102579 [Clonorchis sinensis]